jgi:hypothetical protein
MKTFKEICTDINEMYHIWHELQFFTDSQGGSILPRDTCKILIS